MTLHFVLKAKNTASDRRSGRSDSARVPVYVRIKDGKKVDQTARTDILVNPNWWNEKLEELALNSKCPVDEKIQTNQALSDLRSHLINAYLNDKRAHRIHPEWLKNEVRTHGIPHGNDQDILNLMEEYCEEKLISEVRKESYIALGKALMHFEAYRSAFVEKKYHLDLKALDLDFLYEFQIYLASEASLYDVHPEFYKSLGFPRHPRPRSQNTVIDLFKKLRAFYRWYAQKSQISDIPFNGFRIPREIYGTPICLTREEVTMIRSARMPVKALEEARDIFVFQCNVGCRVGDLLRLRRSNVSNGELHYIPSKSTNCSGRRVLVPLNKVALSILEKYDGQCGEKLLPFGTVHQYNSAIKKILSMSGIRRQVTVLDPLTRKERMVPIHVVASSHMARRTFINNIYSLVKDPELVASLTGHAEGSQSFLRYREIGSDIKRDLVALLE